MILQHLKLFSDCSKSDRNFFFNKANFNGLAFRPIEQKSNTAWLKEKDTCGRCSNKERYFLTYMAKNPPRITHYIIFPSLC